MADFTLDTSGAVPKLSTPHHVTGSIMWSDLSPFEQGYVEGLFASLRKGDLGYLPLETIRKELAFSNLHPETLVAIRRDCAAHEKSYPLTAADPRRHGRGFNFWRNRRAGMWASSGWPPPTPFLDDEGKVRLREAAR